MGARTIGLVKTTSNAGRWLVVLALGACACSKEVSGSREASSADQTTPRMHHPVAVGDRGRVPGPFAIPIPGAKLTLIEYFATWCGSSSQWMPVVQAMNEKYASSGLAVVAVPNYDDETSAVDLEAFVRSHGATFPVAPDKDKHIFGTYSPGNWGQRLVAVDAEGVVRLVHVGTSPEAFKKVDEQIADILQAHKWRRTDP